MDLFTMIIVIAVIGVLLYLINQYLPMDARVKQILNIVVIVAIILWVLFIFLGIDITRLGNIRVGK